MAFWLVLFMLIFAPFTMFNGDGGTMQSREMTYTEFVNAVVAGTLEQDRLAEGYIGPFPCADPVG